MGGGPLALQLALLRVALAAARFLLCKILVFHPGSEKLPTLASTERPAIGLSRRVSSSWLDPFNIAVAALEDGRAATKSRAAMIPGVIMDLATHILLLLCGYLSFKALRLAPTFLASRHNNIYDCIPSHSTLRGHPAV